MKKRFMLAGIFIGFMGTTMPCARSSAETDKKCLTAQKENITLQTHPAASVWPALASGRSLPSHAKQRLFIQDCQSEQARKAHAAIAHHTINDATVRFATYNVHFWTDPYSRKNYDAIVQAVKDSNADVLVLQEAHMYDTKKITADMMALGYTYQTFYSTMNIRLAYGPGEFGTLLLSKYPYTQEPTKRPFSTDKNASEKRGFINARIQLPNQKIVSVYGSHLDVWDETESRRIEEIRDLLQVIAKDPHENICIMADFNAVRSQDYQDTVKGKKIWDILVADDGRRLSTTKVPTSTLDMLVKKGFHDCFTRSCIANPAFTSWPGKVVDFIQLNGSWRIPIKGCYVAYTAASDHCPVIMDISTKEHAEKSARSALVKIKSKL